MKLYLGRFYSIVFLLFLQLDSINLQKDFISNINSPDKKYGYGFRVIYEMNVGAFTNEGKFESAGKRLAELKSLGIDVIWLMPIYKRDGGLNSPYAASDFRTPNPSYGSIEDLKNFVSLAHKLNMEVWLDWVPNHTANNHPWIGSHPDYYASNQHPFYNDVTQLNYENNNLRNEMTNILKYYVDKADIDGYRCDFIASPYIPNDYWTKTIPELKNYKSGKSLSFLGEADFSDVTRLFDAGFDYDYAWWFQETALWKTVGSGNNAEILKKVCDQLTNDNRYSNTDRMLYLTNHDVNFNHNVKLSDMYGENRYAFTVLIFTLYGMPLVYNGQEIGGQEILNYFTDSKINWNNRDNKMYNTIRTLAALKHSVQAFKDGKKKEERGSITWVKSDNNIAAYIRKNGNSQALVVLNLGNKVDVTLNGVSEGKYTQWIDSKTIANGVSQKNVELSSKPTINLDKNGYAVYVKN